MADSERTGTRLGAGTAAALARAVPPWVARQRWYAATGRPLSLRRVGGLHLDDPSGRVGIEIFLVLDTAPKGSEGSEGSNVAEASIYQVPLTFRGSPLAGADTALVAVLEEPGGTQYVYDAPHDPAFAAALLRLVLDEVVLASAVAPGDTVARGSRSPDVAVGSYAGSSVLRGEQSNTSVIYELVDDAGRPAMPVIVKMFRALHDGENPEVGVQSALASAGCRLVPLPVGSVWGKWSDPRVVSGNAAGHLAFAQEFLPGVEDAWREAVRSIAADRDFTARARSLGQATAEVHGMLAEVFPTEAATDATVEEALAGMRRGLAAAVSDVPDLDRYQDAIEATFAAAADVPWPALQRIHGDYHLGQVLDVPGRGWVLLDFEGEPMRPLSQRCLPDLALRDVAGMLRSFDYVAGSFEQAHPGRSGVAWAAAARGAFLEGYADRSGHDVSGDPATRVLLDALEMDKALYEVVYEARNRPTWLSIPTQAVARLEASSRSSRSHPRSTP